jgi:transposase
VPVVVDKFHVVRMANYCMERVRIRLQKKRAGRSAAVAAVQGTS